MISPFRIAALMLELKLREHGITVPAKHIDAIARATLKAWLDECVKRGHDLRYTLFMELYDDGKTDGGGDHPGGRGIPFAEGIASGVPPKDERSKSRSAKGKR